MTILYEFNHTIEEMISNNMISSFVMLIMLFFCIFLIMCKGYTRIYCPKKPKGLIRLPPPPPPPKNELYVHHHHYHHHINLSHSSEVEQRTDNSLVLGSIPSGTIKEALIDIKI